MSPSLTNLKLRCQELRLEVRPKGRRPAKEPYLQALRTYFLKRDYPAGLPYAELCPMLAFPHWALKPAEQEAVWNDDNNWICQEKFNGTRLIVHFVKDVGVFAHSRVISAKTFRRTERRLFDLFVPSFNATVDGEELETAIQVFDIMHWQGVDLRPLPLWERLTRLGDFRAEVDAAELGDQFAFPPIVLTGKRAFFDQIIARGGEGCLLKNPNNRYDDSMSRSRHGWIKVKKMVSFTAFVSGLGRAKSGKGVGYLVFSVHTEAGDHVIAKVSTISKRLRADAEKLLGRVAVVTGQEISRRAHRLSHPRVVRWYKPGVTNECRYPLGSIKT